MLEIRQATPEDVPRILELQATSYPTLSKISAWQAFHLDRHRAHFPEGQLVAVEDGFLAGFSASFVTRSERALRLHTFREVTVRGTFDGHDPAGDTLYGAEIMVHPEFRGRGIGSKLYAARFGLVRRLGLRYFVAGGRLPGFGEAPSQETIEQYVESVVRGARTDRVLTPQLRNGLRVGGILPDYLNDPKSRNFAALLVWENPEWGPPPLGASGQRAFLPASTEIGDDGQ